jgi:hypothetical protein
VNPSKVTINGGSDGGLLVPACVNQAPELYDTALAEVGGLNMLRFPRFTIGFVLGFLYLSCFFEDADVTSLVLLDVLGHLSMVILMKEKHLII